MKMTQVMQGLETSVQWLETIEWKKPETWTAFTTLLLFLATILLVVATDSLRRVAAQERESHKAIATARGWDDLRAEIDLEKLPLEEDKVVLRRSLGKVERFATLVNRGVYDLDLFVLMSGSWFLASRFHKVVAERQEKAKNARKRIPYTQIEKLRQSVQKRIKELNLETAE